jgi:probable HAF family extracellular repeat protein
MSKYLFFLILLVSVQALSSSECDRSSLHGSNHEWKSKHRLPRYKVQELGAELPGSVAHALNDFGMVVGSSANEWGQPSATLWYGGETIDLGTLGGQHSYAAGVNNRGQVVGTSATADVGNLPFIWKDGEMRAIPGIMAGQAMAINDLGQVVGIAYEGSLVRAFVYDGQELRYLSDISDYVAAYSINNRGQIVGSMSVGDGEYHAFVWEDGVFTDLESLGGHYDTAYDINDHGVVVGSSSDEGHTTHATMWVGSAISKLGVNEQLQSKNSFAWSINNRGEIVGESRGSDDHAFYYRAGNLIELNSLTHPPQTEYNYALSINKWGAIAGASYTPEGDGARATLWSPVKKKF